MTAESLWLAPVAQHPGVHNIASWWIQSVEIRSILSSQDGEEAAGNNSGELPGEVLAVTWGPGPGTLDFEFPMCDGRNDITK